MLGAMPAQEPSDDLLDKILAGLDDAPAAVSPVIVLDRAWPVLPEWRRNLVRYGTYAAAGLALASFFVAGHSLRRTREEIDNTQVPALQAAFPMNAATSREIQFLHEDWRESQPSADWRGSGADISPQAHEYPVVPVSAPRRMTAVPSTPAQDGHAP